MSPKSAKPDATVDAVAMRVRERRRQLGWSFARTARAAKIASPAYVFHIENGHKAPSERVAARLAQALGMDEELLRAWARARRPDDLAMAIEAVATVGRFLGSAIEASIPGVSPPPDAGEDRAPASFIEVALLPEGADPETAAPIETHRLERRLFPPLPGEVRAVAYRLSANAVRRVAGQLFAGDFAVVLVGGGEPALDAPCAVRRNGRVEMARVRVRDEAVYLPAHGAAPDAGGVEANLDALGERIPGRAADVIVGPVVAAFRRWL